MIDWGESYKASWRVMAVDPATWADSYEVTGAKSFSVDRDSTGRLMESGSASFELAQGEQMTEFWARVEVLAEQAGEVQREAVATMLLSPSPSTVKRGRNTQQMEGRSVLAPAEDRVMLAGTYVPKGANGAESAARLLRECTPAPITVEGSFVLSDHVTFARGTSYLEAAWMVLDAVGWCIQVSGDGRVTIRRKPTEPSLTLDTSNMKLIGTEVTINDDLTSVPNRFIAVDGELVGIAVNSDPASPISTVSRGRYVDMYEESPTRADGESVQAYANRRLAEEMEHGGERSYSRAWMPNLTCFDLVRCTVPSMGLDGDMRIKSQSIQIGGEISVSETLEVIA